MSETDARDRIPSADVIRPIVLEVLASQPDQAPVTASALVTAVADRLGLSSHARQREIPSGGQTIIANRVQWSTSSFFHAGLLTKPRRGEYVITTDGRTVADRHLVSYSQDDLREWPAWRDYMDTIVTRRAHRSGLPPSRARGNAESAPIHASDASTAVQSGEDAEEQIASLIEALNARTEADLRHHLQESSPDFFEQVVIDLLWAMGYGGAHGERQRLGGTGDGGVDGVIRQDALGLRTVYVQAKRYNDSNTVGSAQIREFYGALASKKASAGVFITTSTFTRDAEATAKQYHDRSIVLIDGSRLTRLMLDYGVGVSDWRAYTVKRIDQDYFDQGLA